MAFDRVTVRRARTRMVVLSTASLPSLGEASLTAKIKAASTAKVGAVESCLITATSIGDATKKDVVRATAKVK